MGKHANHPIKQNCLALGFPLFLGPDVASSTRVHQTGWVLVAGTFQGCGLGLRTARTKGHTLHLQKLTVQ